MTLTPTPFLPADDNTGDSDLERYAVYQPGHGAPVDEPDIPITVTWADAVAGRARARVPILPAWMLSAAQRRAWLRATLDAAGYFTAFHTVRLPKYALKASWWALLGTVKTAGRLLRWASAEQHNWQLRQHAATSGDAHTWQALNRTRAKEAKGRWWAVAAGSAAVCGGGSALAAADVMPVIGWYGVGAGLLVAAARAGRPAGHTVTDRVTIGPRFTRLTAEQVRAAIVALGVGVKEVGQLEFPQPIHRDGPGWLARVNLPAGIEAVKVIESRPKLSSALRLPVDQVWPGAGPDHAGQVDLWVGYQPASKMGQPVWALTKDGARTSVFNEHPFGSDERQRPVLTSMFARSFLIGGQPGSGKSFAGRALTLTAALDPTVQLLIAEFKGTGDFLDLEPLCSTYVVGVDDAAFRAGAGIFTWALGEAERRGKRILAARQRGDAPEGKVTPELAKRPGSGLHPIVIVMDEVHELFAADPNAADACERLIKRARALGIIVILLTQIPDKTSLPPNITRCVTNRWCLSVAGQVENDMILGTGAYKRGLTGTVYRPVVDAGWGMMTGGSTPQAVRSQYPTPSQAADIIARAIAMRHGKPVGAHGEQVIARDLLADLHSVAAGNGQHWAQAAESLVQQWPEAYPALNSEALSRMASTLGLASRDVKIGGRNLKGYKIAEVKALIAAREDA